MIVIGDIDFLKENADSPVFTRLERTIKRDGNIISVTKTIMQKVYKIVLGEKQLQRLETKTFKVSQKKQSSTTEKIESIDPPSPQEKIEKIVDIEDKKEKTITKHPKAEPSLGVHQPDLFFEL